MRSINHALTGAVIGLTIGKPLLALPIAVISHYICDAIPHYSPNQPPVAILRSSSFRNQLFVDAGLCFLVVLSLALWRPEHWFLAVVCAFLAAAPDFASINRYRTVRQGKPWQAGRYTRFASTIQWFERPIGIVVEAAWLIGALVLLLPFLR